MERSGCARTRDEDTDVLIWAHLVREFGRDDVVTSARGFMARTVTSSLDPICDPATHRESAITRFRAAVHCGKDAE